jgi:WD40 repeat protein
MPTTSPTVLGSHRHAGEAFAAAFHPNGDRIATAGRDRPIRLRDAACGEVVIQLTGRTGYIFGLA